MSAQAEYRKYLAWVAGQNVTDDAKRVAMVVFDAFDRIAATSANRSQRTSLLLPLLEERMEGQHIALPAFDEIPAAAQSWKQLRQLVVGPFRGFREQETFDLDRPIVLVYGPNGTGKSSFCEALEFTLLGSVDEAAAKRIPEGEYLRNVHARRYEAPVLTVTGPDGDGLKVAPSLESYRFCFIEKNRIEAFSRMGARTPAQRAEIIATLFGMESFVVFVRNFNADITPSLKLTAFKASELERKRLALATDQATVNGEAAERAALERKKAGVAQAHLDGLTYEAVIALLGSKEAPGRLQELQSALDALPPAETGLDPETLDALRADAQAAHGRHAGFGQQLSDRRAEVNFKSLYEALQGLEPEGLDHCPACETPLSGPGAARENPFDRARKGLAELDALAKLQEQHGQAATAARRASEQLAAYLRRIAGLTHATDAEQPAITALGRLLDSEREGDWWVRLDAREDLAPEVEPAPSLWECARAEAQRAKEIDADTKVLLAKRQAEIAERDRLLAAQRQTDELAILERQLGETIAAARMRIDKFDEMNTKLIAEVGEERTKIGSHQRILAAYNGFLASLDRYKDGLPRALTADLSATALSFYNAFNRNDHQADQLAQLVLPATDDERITVAFNSDPKELQDALQVMSEGHIRCLGLAILVAKNVKLGCPVLIFDDAVNAIDDEHRGGIRDTLFDEGLLGRKQIILTCHGEELIKDIEVFIGHKRAGADCLTYTFLPHDGDRVIRVEPGKTRNYIASARLAFQSGRIREAIGDSRRATEAICLRTWRFLAKHGFGELRVKMERHRQPIESYDLASQLKKNLDHKDFHHPDKALVSEGFAQMLARWGLLNPGTHEEDERKDFPRADVKALIDNLASLDDVLAQKAGAKAAAAAPPALAAGGEAPKSAAAC
jgi:recombinational DNA repair ATPase RecF